MSKINAMMDVGKRSMMNSQTALQTVGHNIANKSTEGYSRQRVEQVTNAPINEGKLQLGMGAKSASVTRVNNPYLEKQIGKEQAQLGFLGGKRDPLTRVESIYNEQVNRGLNQFLGDFFNAFRELANNPESNATRTLVRDTAESVTKDFKRIIHQLGEIQGDIDQQLKSSIVEINGYTDEIARLNEKIQQVQITGSEANDQRDRRDLLLKKLGEKLNIKWAEGTDGTVTITAGNNALLVTGNDARKLSVQATPETDSKLDGAYDIFYMNDERAVPMKITDQLTGGAIGGLLEVRDSVIMDLRDDMDNMAYNLATEVNDIHQAGFNVQGQGGIAFFAPLNGPRHAADNLYLSDEVYDDPNRIAVGAAPNAPGDNRVANAISRLQYEKLMNDGTTTVDDFYDGMVGRVGLMTKKTNNAADSQKDIVKQLTNIRESISGVSLDEETTKMIEFQKNFDASARLVKTADEMFDTVLNLKRL